MCIRDRLYKLKFQNARLKGRDDFIDVNNFSGIMKVKGHNIQVKGAECNLRVQKLFFPLKDLNIESNWRRDSMDVSRINASIFKGNVEGNIDISYGRSVSMDLHFKACSLKELASYYRMTDKSVQGNVFFDVLIDWKKEEDWTANAQGACYIRNGKFYRYPVFFQVFRFLDFEFPGEEREKKADILWSYKNGEFILENIEISDGAVDFFGEGVIKHDRKIDLTLTTELGRSKLLSLPLVGDITRDVSNEIIKQLITIKITGSLDNPQIKKESIERIPEKAIGYFINILKAISSPLTGNGKKEDNGSSANQE